MGSRTGGAGLGSAPAPSCWASYPPLRAPLPALPLLRPHGVCELQDGPHSVGGWVGTPSWCSRWQRCSGEVSLSSGASVLALCLCWPRRLRLEVLGPCSHPTLPRPLPGVPTGAPGPHSATRPSRAPPGSREALAARALPEVPTSHGACDGVPTPHRGCRCSSFIHSFLCSFVHSLPRSSAFPSTRRPSWV